VFNRQSTINERGTVNNQILDAIPIPVFYIIVAALMLASCEIGFQLGKGLRARQDKEAPSAMAGMVGGLLGMLAFVLGFTFSIAASQHAQRKENVILDANAIGTVYLRTDLLDRKYGDEIKNLLREYVDLRLQLVESDNMGPLIVRSNGIHGLIWALVSSAAIETPGYNTALMVNATNDMLDTAEKRLTEGDRTRIPSKIWYALLAITALTMASMGIQIGLGGRRRMLSVIPLVLAFALLVVLALDINRPRSGFITVGQQAMIDLQESIGKE